MAATHLAAAARSPSPDADYDDGVWRPESSLSEDHLRSLSPVMGTNAIRIRKPAAGSSAAHSFLFGADHTAADFPQQHPQVSE